MRMLDRASNYEPGLVRLLTSNLLTLIRCVAHWRPGQTPQLLDQPRQHARRRDRSPPRCWTAPRLKRIEFCVRCAGNPIAFSTCDGSSVPDEQAEPVETATPSRSSAISSDSASTRSKLTVRGVRHARSGAVHGRAAAPRGGSPVRDDRAAPRAGRLRRSSSARRRLGGNTETRYMPATFSVPARRLRSCLPPVIEREPAGRRGESRGRRPPSARRTCAPRATAGRRRGLLTLHRHLAGRLHGVGVEERTAFPGERGQLRHRLNGADLVVGVHDRHEGGVVGQIAARSASGSTTPGLIDRQERDPPAAPGERLQGVQHRLVLDGAGNQVPACPSVRAPRPRRESRSCRSRCRRW